jgi:hypothetical protein
VQTLVIRITAGRDDGYGQSRNGRQRVWETDRVRFQVYKALGGIASLGSVEAKPRRKMSKAAGEKIAAAQFCA